MTGFLYTRKYNEAMWADSSDDSDCVEVPASSEEASPQPMHLRVRRGERSARFAVLPCDDGWYEHFIEGDATLRRYVRYVCDESVDELHAWWRAEFDSHQVGTLPVPEASALHVPAKCQGARWWHA